MDAINPQPQNDFLETQVNKNLLVVTLTMAFVYFVILAFWFPRGNPALFVLLIIGEIFHLWQALTFIYAIWDTKNPAKFDVNFALPVDVFITVAGEPAGVVAETAAAALNLDYPDFKVYILNDGKVTGKSNWKEIQTLAKKLGVTCITRDVPGGAKAGNINNALLKSWNPFVAIFDADQVPHSNFLKKMMGYFYDPRIGFVQSPQFYKNSALNEITGGAWEQQELFFGPICKGKNRSNAVFMCGTNMVINKKALLAVGGMCENNIAEDFLTSLFIHQKGYKSVYVDEVLAEGLAPEDFLSYYKQQFRWARGSLEVVFRHNPFFKRGLSFGQRIHYLAGASYYLSGTIVLLNALLPLIFFYTGLVPLNISTMILASIFLPYILLTIVSLRVASNFTYTFRALAFSMSSFALQIQALFAIIFGIKSNFSVTSKKQLQGNFVYLALPHILYIVFALLGLEIAVLREGLSAAVLSNASWALFNISVFVPFILAAIPEFNQKKQRESVPYPTAVFKNLPTSLNSPSFSIVGGVDSVEQVNKKKTN
jgi:cellulose synthase (UDP-forming)